MAASRLGNAGRRSGRVALAVTSALLDEGEIVECAVQGRFNGADGVAVLTNERVLVVNDRSWKPDVLEIEVDGSTTVQGWQDDRTAALVFQRADQSATVDKIGDRHLAMEFAQRLRARAAG